MRFPFRRNPDARLREVMAELDAFHARGGQDAPRTFASVACREQHFRMPLYRYWCDAIRERPRFHRKQWEYVYICQSLHERGRLAPGMRGLGFGVGREPLVALFASLGAEVLATDLERSRAENLGWAETNQHSASIDELNDRGICPPGDFRDRVAYRDVDMNAIPGDLTGFDFCWSSCALEHLGSIRKGLDFIERSIATLAPGGVAVHTTELNLSSAHLTIDDNPACVLFRRKDLEAIAERLRDAGHEVEPFDFTTGTDAVERFVDLPPYRSEPHLRLRMEAFLTTSMGLIVRRSQGR